jgi:hypothetical protein
VLALVALTTTMACSSPGPVGPDPGTRATLEQQARAELAAYSRALKAADGVAQLRPIGPVTTAIGSWPATDVNPKRAFSAGLFRVAGPLDATVPATGRIRWSNGRTRQVALITPAAAVARCTPRPAATATAAIRFG